MGEHASLLIAILHEESRHDRLTVTKDSRAREAHLVIFSEKRGLYATVNLDDRALQVLVRLIARVATDEVRVIDGRLEESVTSCRLYFVIPDLLELIICVCGKHTDRPEHKGGVQRIVGAKLSAAAKRCQISWRTTG